MNTAAAPDNQTIYVYIIIDLNEICKSIFFFLFIQGRELSSLFLVLLPKVQIMNSESSQTGT